MNLPTDALTQLGQALQQDIATALSLHESWCDMLTGEELSNLSAIAADLSVVETVATEAIALAAWLNSGWTLSRQSPSGKNRHPSLAAPQRASVFEPSPASAALSQISHNARWQPSVVADGLADSAQSHPGQSPDLRDTPRFESPFGMAEPQSSSRSPASVAQSSGASVRSGAPTTVDQPDAPSVAKAGATSRTPQRESGPATANSLRPSPIDDPSLPAIASASSTQWGLAGLAQALQSDRAAISAELAQQARPTSGQATWDLATRDAAAQTAHDSTPQPQPRSRDGAGVSSERFDRVASPGGRLGAVAQDPARLNAGPAPLPSVEQAQSSEIFPKASSAVGRSRVAPSRPLAHAAPDRLVSDAPEAMTWLAPLFAQRSCLAPSWLPQPVVGEPPVMGHPPSTEGLNQPQVSDDIVNPVAAFLPQAESSSQALNPIPAEASWPARAPAVFSTAMGDAAIAVASDGPGLADGAVIVQRDLAAHRTEGRHPVSMPFSSLAAPITAPPAPISSPPELDLSQVLSAIADSITREYYRFYSD